MKNPLVVVGLVFLAALTGCVGDGSFMGDMMDPPADPTTYTGIARGIFEIRCAKSGCHVGASAPRGLQLDEANAYDLLVDFLSDEQPSLFRVEPGNPDDSYLVIKIEGTDPRLVDRRMPRDGPPFLSTEEIANIRAWITSGAPRN